MDLKIEVNIMTNDADFSEDNDNILVTDFCLLVHKLVTNINSLEEEVVRWRQALIKYLPSQYAEGLRADIFSNLSYSFSDNVAYIFYMNQVCHGKDPMEDEEHLLRMIRLRDGMDETSVFF